MSLSVLHDLVFLLHSELPFFNELLDTIILVNEDPEGHPVETIHISTSVALIDQDRVPATVDSDRLSPW